MAEQADVADVSVHLCGHGRLSYIMGSFRYSQQDFAREPRRCLE
jgi:hypothetical protein